MSICVFKLGLNTQIDIRSISKRVVGANETKSLSD